MQRILFVALVAATLGSTAAAATISSTIAPVASGPGLGLVNVPAIVTLNQNNDNQVGGEATDNNLVIPLKRFDNNDYIDIVFTINSSDGTTEYKVTEFVDNNTGSPWSSYKVQLGSGVGPLFVAATSGGLHFDAPTYDAPPSSAPLSVVATSAYELIYSGGIQGTGAVPYTLFSMLAIGCLAASSFAGTIVDPPVSVSGTGLGFANVTTVTLSPSNDGDGNGPGPAVLDNNISVPLKRFDNVGYIDIVFAVNPSLAVTEYLVSEFVDNNTGLPWSEYDVILGMGTGGQFVKSAAGDGLDLDAPFALLTPPKSTAFAAAVPVDEDQISYSIGVHGAGAQGCTFRIDVPNNYEFSRCGRFRPRCQSRPASRS